MYKIGDYINTTKGFMLVQCGIPFKKNNNPKYNKLGGRTLYWLVDEQFQDVFLFDHELLKILIEEQEEYL